MTKYFFNEGGKMQKFKGILKNMLTVLIFGVMATGICLAFSAWNFPETNLVVVYILSVLLVARLTDGYLYGLIASIGSLLMYNWFFTEPYMTLKVSDPTDFVTFAIMMLTSIITSALTSKVKENAAEASAKEAAARTLYLLTNRLTEAVDMQEIAEVAVGAIGESLSCQAGCLCFRDDGIPEDTFVQQRSDGLQIRRKLRDREELRRLLEGRHDAFVIGAEFWNWPIYGQETMLGVIRIPSMEAEKLSGEQTRLLHSIIESISLAMDRLHSAKMQARIQEQAMQERYRSDLLRAISHDLRTPLSGIMGNSEMLMSMTEMADERYRLAQSIYEDAAWLKAMVENILHLTRLQEGRLALNPQPEAVEEVVGAALAAIEKRCPEREFAVEIPDELMMVPMDAHLISQVLVNLLDNAARHTKREGEIRLTVSQENHMARFSVRDEGVGISESDLPHVFQAFYTTATRGADARRGIGLGLSICESIVKAHGGTIMAQNRTDRRGAEFIFEIPMEGRQDATV